MGCGKSGGEGVKETSQQVENARVAAEKYNRFKTVYTPFRNKFIADVTRETTDQEDRVAGQVRTEIAKANQGAIPVGVDPSTGSSVSNKNALQVGALGSRATTSAEQGVRDQSMAAQKAAIDIGNGESADATFNYGSLASDAVKSQYSDVLADETTKRAYGDSVGTAVGAGLAFYKNK